MSWIKQCKKKLVFVLHINHPNEINDEVQQYISKIKLKHTVLLNQSVLLKRVNDSSKILTLLAEKLFETGVLPYYLHLLDPVKGTAHFSVSASKGIEIIKDLKRQLPGYLVPRLAQEILGRIKAHFFLLKFIYFKISDSHKVKQAIQSQDWKLNVPQLFGPKVSL